MARRIHKLAASPRQVSQSKVQDQASYANDLVHTCLASSPWCFSLLVLVLLSVYGIFYRYGAVWNNAAWLSIGMLWVYLLLWGGWRQQRLGRRVWLSAYWHPHSRAQQLLSGGVVMGAWQLGKAILVVPFLLVGPFLFTQTWQWLWLAALTLMALPVFFLWRRLLAPHVTPLLLPLLAWRLAAWGLMLTGAAAYVFFALRFTEEGQYANLLDELFQQSRSGWLASSWLFEFYQWVSLKAALRWALGGQLGTLWVNDELRLAWRALLHLPEVLWCGLWLKALGKMAFLPRCRSAAATPTSLIATGLAFVLAVTACVMVVRAYVHQPQLLTVDGRYYVVTQRQQTLLEQKANAFWQAQQGELIQQANHLVGQQVTHLFARARERVPGLVEHYYSLGAEYQRMLLAGAYLIGAGREDQQAKEVWARLMPELQNEAWFEVLQTKTQALEEAWLQESLGLWHEELTRWLGQPLKDYVAPTATANTLKLDALERSLDLAQQQFVVRQQLSGFAFGAGVATGVGARLLLKRVASKQLPSQFLKGLAARAGAGALLCSPTGLGAVGCAAVGAGTWLVTDYALLKLEEAQRGEQMQQSLYLMLDRHERLMMSVLRYDEIPMEH